VELFALAKVFGYELVYAIATYNILIMVGS
jgi:hypothetical protein